MCVDLDFIPTVVPDGKHCPAVTSVLCPFVGTLVAMVSAPDQIYARAPTASCRPVVDLAPFNSATSDA